MSRGRTRGSNPTPKVMGHDHGTDHATLTRGSRGALSLLPARAAVPAGAGLLGLRHGAPGARAHAGDLSRLGPAAIFLALGGQWGKAITLVAWGAIAIGLVDNLLYPFLVRSRMRLHTLPVFFAILGGVSLFGAAGIVVGPLILSVTDALIDVWRRRTAQGRTADRAAT
ncbi:MAG: AI-2E family transporter [Candidatus Rokuibacteriota bacterium]